MSERKKENHTFTRPGLPPMNITVELQSDQPPQPLDRAAACLHVAAEALRKEIECCPRGERRDEVANLMAKAIVITRRVEEIGGA